MTAKDEADRYGALQEEKKRLEARIKEVGRQLEEQKQRLVQAMIDEESPVIRSGGFRYGLLEKTVYQKIGEEKLKAAGLDFFAALRSAGLEHLITETANPASLNAAVKDYVKEHGSLPVSLSRAITVWEGYDVSFRKDRKTAKINPDFEKLFEDWKEEHYENQ